MFHWLSHLRVESPSVLLPVDVVAAALVLAVLVVPVLAPSVPRGRARDLPGRAVIGLRRSLVGVAAIVAAAVIGLVAVWYVGDVLDLFGVQFTPITRMWIAFLAGAVGLAGVVLWQGDWRRRVLCAVALVAVALATTLGINVDFGAYEDLQQAIDTNPYPKGDLAHEHAAVPGATVVDPADWTAPAGMPVRGRIEQVAIHGTVSHFRARHADVYLPPAALTADPPTLPVLIALSGQPGSPSDMFESGALGADLDAYAAGHHGLAPIVVAPDQLGAPGRNPMCLDTRALGRSATYIETDVVHWVEDHLDVGAAPDAWGITGFSEGATCAMQFSAAHPERFGTTLAISSEIQPFNGSVQHTATVAFHGSVAAYLAASPSHVMAEHAPYHDHLTVFAYGSDDAPYEASTTALRAAAEHAGMQTQLIVSPGSAHDWNTVRYALVHGLPSVIQHLGLRG